MNTATAEKPVTEAVPTIIGTAFGGGRYMGRGFIGIVPYAIVLPGKAERYSAAMRWNKTLKAVPGANSYCDGLTNTEAMVAAGSPLAKWSRDLRIGGFDDWHLLCRQDALVISGNLPEAGPDFAEGGPEAFEWEGIWTSTQHREGPGYAWCQNFGGGGQYGNVKSVELRGVAVRRELIP